LPRCWTLDAHYLKEVGLDRTNIRATRGDRRARTIFFLPGEEGPGDLQHEAGRRDGPDPKIEPINFVDGHAPPMLLLQGMKDDVVEPV